MDKSLEHLKVKGVLINEITEFTDQDASQYKSKQTFYTLSRAKPKYLSPGTSLLSSMKRIHQTGLFIKNIAKLVD